MRLAHGRVGLALHELSAEDDASTPTLLLLHALGGSVRDWHAPAAVWPGAVHALDFAGHGASDWLPGGGYTPEGFAGDADSALRAIEGDVCIAGAGIGAYVALLISGARPVRVRGTLLLDGRGFDGGGAAPDYYTGEPKEGAAPKPVTSRPLAPQAPDEGDSDPAVALCDLDLRPTDYAEEFARAASRLLLGVREAPPPPWLEAVERLGRCVHAPGRADLALEALQRVVAADTPGTP